MQVITQGKEFHSGRKVPIGVYRGDYSMLNEPGDFRLVYIKDGQGIIDNGVYKVNFISPCVYCVNERETVSIISEDQLDIAVIRFNPEFVNVTFNYEYLNEWEKDDDITRIRDQFWLNPFTNRNGFQGLIVVNEYQVRRVDEIIDYINYELTTQQDGYWPCRTRSFFIELLISLERFYQNIDVTLDQRIVEKDNCYDLVVKYLNENYMKKVTLESLSKRFHVNRTTLNQLFQKEISKTALQYLKEVRMTTAAVMLKSTELLITEITARVGYQDKANFNRTFYKCYKLSPKEYREKNTWL